MIKGCKSLASLFIGLLALAANRAEASCESPDSVAIFATIDRHPILIYNTCSGVSTGSVYEVGEGKILSCEDYPSKNLAALRNYFGEYGDSKPCAVECDFPEPGKLNPNELRASGFEIANSPVMKEGKQGCGDSWMMDGETCWQVELRRSGQAVAVGRYYAEKPSRNFKLYGKSGEGIIAIFKPNDHDKPLVWAENPAVTGKWTQLLRERPKNCGHSLLRRIDKSALKLSLQLNTEGFRLYQDKKLQEAHQKFHCAVCMNADHWLAIYNLACVSALEGLVDESFELLEKAVELAPNQVRKRMKTDPDLKRLRSESEERFKSLLNPS